MKLFELFDEGPLNVTDEIKDDLKDILTPLVAARVPFVTVQHIIEKLAAFRTGVTIDRGLVFSLLDPDQIALIDKIEGDRIYLKLPGEMNREVGQDDAEKDKEHVSKMATKQAQKGMGDV